MNKDAVMRKSLSTFLVLSCVVLAAPLSVSAMEDERGDLSASRRSSLSIPNQAESEGAAAGGPERVGPTSAPAQYNLGWCYENGFGVAGDLVLANHWYQKAADKGYAEAQFIMGNHYASGSDGVDRDLVRAVELLQKAADQGHTEAQFAMGARYQTGRGVAQNHACAAKWFQKAAGQGRPEALAQLGLCYEKGWGVAKDFTLVVGCFQKAVDLGVASAGQALEELLKKL